jgi:dihydrofolate reductase
MPTAEESTVRKLKVGSLVSIDGISKDPRAWASAYFDEDAARRSLEQLLASDAMLMGRATYEYFQPVWPRASGPYMDRINAIRKYVFSSSLPAVEWDNAELVAGDAIEAVSALKRHDGGDLVVYGYGRLARSLVEHGLVDELDFWIHPVLLGTGRHTPVRLASVDERARGVVGLRYGQEG